MKLNAVLGLDTSPFAGGVTSALGGINDLMAGFRGMLAPLAGMTAGFLGVGAAVAGLKQAVMESAGIEDFQASFVTLLGSTDAAMERLADLSKFAAATPFELPEIAQASRTLETLTRGALSTGQGLALVGNVAAATQQPFGDLATVIGRLYDGLQSGRPVGEVMMRLQELGVISGEVRGKIEALQASGAAGESVWRVAAESFGRFAGEMDRKSQTLNGRMSTLSDAWKGLQREIGAPVLEVARGEVSKLTSGLEEMADILRTVKSYWADVFVIAQGKGLGGMETVKSLLEQAKALESVADKERLVANAGRELERLQDRAAAAPALNFSPAVDQVKRLLTWVEQLPPAFFKVTEAQRSAAAALSEIEAKRPELEKTLNDSVRDMSDERDRGVLRDKNADPVERQIAAITIAQRATEGVLTTPPQNLEQAKERLEIEMQLVEQMKQHPEMLGLAAEKAKGIAEAYRSILALQGELTSIVSQGLQQSVSDAIEEIYGSVKNGLTGMPEGWRDSLRSITSDRLQRIGGFIGGAGGPAADYARRCAVAGEVTVGEMRRLNNNFERFAGSDFGVARWGER